MGSDDRDQQAEEEQALLSREVVRSRLWGSPLTVLACTALLGTSIAVSAYWARRPWKLRTPERSSLELAAWDPALTTPESSQDETGYGPSHTKDSNMRGQLPEEQSPASPRVCFDEEGQPTTDCVLPAWSAEVRDKLWKEAAQEVYAMPPQAYADNERYACDVGKWGDSGQVNEWDSGFSPCWPSSLAVAASWDTKLMARWSLEIGTEFAKPNRGQLGPGVNVARFAWNGRLGEYLSGEDPVLGAKMVAAMVSAYRLLPHPPLQTVKHVILNSIETGRNWITEVVDERTLFEVYYPPFQAAIDNGVSVAMCSYNQVQCTTGVCSGKPSYACANDDILNKHLRDKMGFKGFVMSDWDATKCQDQASNSLGCHYGGYIDKFFAAAGGLDVEMPKCMSFAQGLPMQAGVQEKAIRIRWAYKVQNRSFDNAPQGSNKGYIAPNQRRLRDEASWTSPSPSPPSPPPPPPPPPLMTTQPRVGADTQICAWEGKENYKSKCKLDLAEKIIVESTVLLKNEDSVLPLQKSLKVALVGSQACTTKPLQAWGSGWNGFSCQQVPKITLQEGVEDISGQKISCPGKDGDNEEDAMAADVIIAAVAPGATGEGNDRGSLQLAWPDAKLLLKYMKAGKKVVVAMNAPGPMVTSFWDAWPAAIVVSWMPGQQFGRGIAQVLYGEDGAQPSGRLPFTFPKCKSPGCTIDDERASVLLGDKIASGEYTVYSEKALVGYRWYHAMKKPVSFPFGFGLFAYGSATVQYSGAEASVDQSGVQISAQLYQDGDRDGYEVPQLYISFPDSIPGEPNQKPEWVLKGFEKVLLVSGVTKSVTFRLTHRDLSYWDDGPGQSKWVCSTDTFKACIGANSRDAIVAGKGSCAEFTPTCE